MSAVFCSQSVLPQPSLACSVALVAFLCGCLSFRGLERPSEDEPEAQDLAFTLANSCNDDLPDGAKVGELPALSFDGFEDEMSSFEDCGASEDLGGVDGFFAFEANEDQRVFVRATPSGEEQELGIFFLRDCDENSCRKVQNRCGSGLPEYTSFIAQETRQYVVGIDSSSEESVDLELLLPICGDGNEGPGESCDDGNLDAGDGCDSLCRAEIAGLEEGQEIEPNDDTLEANVIVADDGFSRFEVQGTLQGDCDIDRFLVTIPDGYGFAAQLADEQGSPCDPDAPPLRLEFQTASETGRVLGIGEVSNLPDQGSCPGIPFDAPFATQLTGQDYMLTVRHEITDEGFAENPFEYRLIIVLRPSAGIPGAVSAYQSAIL